MKPVYLLTFDVETTSIARNGLFDDIGMKVLNEGLPPLLDMLDRYNFKSTFFYTGYIARKFPKVVKIVHDKGHEIASHGFVHDPDQAFDILSYKEQVKHLSESKKILEDITGDRIISFRAPALRINENTPIALKETGFEIDSSIASQRFDMFLSFGSLKKMNRLIAPRSPYFTSENNLAKKGNGSILEIPVSALVVPYIGTTHRIMPNMMKGLRVILKMESVINPQKPIVFLFHPNEILSEEINTKFKKRAKNIISYFFADYIRRNLKLKNLGSKALIILENDVEYFHKHNFQFLTLQDFAKKMNRKTVL